MAFLFINFSLLGSGVRVSRGKSDKVYYSFLLEQKMDKNKDGVVTIDEFIESCQKVSKESKGTIVFAFPAAGLSTTSYPT